MDFHPLPTAISQTHVVKTGRAASVRSEQAIQARTLPSHSVFALTTGRVNVNEVPPPRRERTERAKAEADMLQTKSESAGIEQQDQIHEQGSRSEHGTPECGGELEQPP